MELFVFHIPGYTGELRNIQFAGIRWVQREELADFDFLDADRSVIEALIFFREQRRTQPSAESRKLSGLAEVPHQRGM